MYLELRTSRIFLPTHSWSWKSCQPGYSLLWWRECQSIDRPRTAHSPCECGQTPPQTTETSRGSGFGEGLSCRPSPTQRQGSWPRRWSQQVWCWRYRGWLCRVCWWPAACCRRGEYHCHQTTMKWWTRHEGKWGKGLEKQRIVLYTTTNRIIPQQGISKHNKYRIALYFQGV